MCIGLGHFVTPDSFVQDPYSTLSYNRYSYVWNNPLMYVDPSGEFFRVAVNVGAASGAGAGFAGGFVGGAGNSWLNGGNFGQGLRAGLKDGLAG
ncbi:RHS repeat-associated core domain-containing protein [Pseudozobellia thermophila]|uniref:RHS repeat-associated core domain-containing protein n=1 Tax=Pseudozobellia thermophila TaxID=192903 RepID=A0A1M6LIN1_9FLAO|nr:hypothetical protein [Pseudozobellia thermophila]SHJ71008.1 RHS repeat-associated core domain-containing protein [Pseudozobellia thermophila]